MSKEKTELETKKARYSRIKQVVESSGWKDIVDILEVEYTDALETLKTSDDEKKIIGSRHIIQFIDNFLSSIKAEIGFGKQAQEKYIKKYTNVQGE